MKRIAERLPAAVRLMAEAVTGGDTKKLFQMMKDGKLDPNTALPKFFEILEAKANGGWDSYVKTTRYQQNKAGVGFENSLELFRTSGGNDAFFKGWKAIADSLPKMDGLVKMIAHSFGVLADGVVRVSDILVMFSDWSSKFNSLAPSTQNTLETLGVAWLLFGTRVGRAMLPLTALMLLLDDMAVYNQGGKSLIGDALDGNGGAMLKLAGLGGAFALAGGGGIGGKTVAGVATGVGLGAGLVPAGIMAASVGSAFAANENFKNFGITPSTPYGYTASSYDPRFTTSGASKTSNPIGAMEAVMQSGNLMHEMYGSMGAAITVNNLEINANTNDPDEHAYLFMKAIGDTMPHFHNPEGY